MRAFSSGSSRGNRILVIARLSPFRHCEARSAEAIPGSDRPYDEGLRPKGSSLSVRPSDCFAPLAMTRRGSLRGFPPSSLRGFSPLVIARHEVPKQSRVPIDHTMKALGRKDPPSQSSPSDCFAPLAMTRRGSLRGFPPLVIARHEVPKQSHVFPSPFQGESRPNKAFGEPLSFLALSPAPERGLAK